MRRVRVPVGRILVTALALVMWLIALGGLPQALAQWVEWLTLVQPFLTSEMGRWILAILAFVLFLGVNVAPTAPSKAKNLYQRPPLRLTGTKCYRVVQRWSIWELADHYRNAGWEIPDTYPHSLPTLPDDDPYAFRKIVNKPLAAFTILEFALVHDEETPLIITQMSVDRWVTRDRHLAYPMEGNIRDYRVYDGETGERVSLGKTLTLKHGDSILRRVEVYESVTHRIRQLPWGTKDSPAIALSDEIRVRIETDRGSRNFIVDPITRQQSVEWPGDWGDHPAILEPGDIEGRQDRESEQDDCIV